ncbi:MAG: protein kinase [Nannocystaceae bacterium]|nr:protein kinase [Nannocystaceae bacterium]
MARASVLRGLFGDQEPAPSVGRYVLRTLLGRGAHGRVFVADDPVLRRQVAVKLVSRTRSRGEAEALAQLSHPNVVRVFDWGNDRGQAFIVMELVDGVDLGRVMTEEAPNTAQILALFRDAGAGLAAAHREGRFIEISSPPMYSSPEPAWRKSRTLAWHGPVPRR